LLAADAVWNELLSVGKVPCNRENTGNVGDIDLGKPPKNPPYHLAV
jgi:hypothetical protein